MANPRSQALLFLQPVDHSWVLGVGCCRKVQPFPGCWALGDPHGKEASRTSGQVSLRPVKICGARTPSKFTVRNPFSKELTSWGLSTFHSISPLA